MLLRFYLYYEMLALKIAKSQEVGRRENIDESIVSGIYVDGSESTCTELHTIRLDVISPEFLLATSAVSGRKSQRCDDTWWRIGVVF